ncbi:MAG: Efflux ABC transporter, ATP-binding protein, partial [uncultured Nocardioides sp.]
DLCPDRRPGPRAHVRRTSQGRGLTASDPRDGAGRPRPHVHRRAGRDGGLHRTERSGEVDDGEDADRHPRPHERSPPGRRTRAPAPPGRARPTHRGRLRSANHPVVGPAAARLVRAAAEDVSHPCGPVPAQPVAVRGAARPRGPARHTGTAALPGPADAGRHHRSTPARPGDPLPRRAHHRARRHQQGQAARVPACPQRRARHHSDADHPRPPGHRGALRPGRRHRPRHRCLRRFTRRPARAGPVLTHARGRPGRRLRADPGRRSRREEGGGTTSVAVLPRRRQRCPDRRRHRSDLRRRGPVDPGAGHRGGHPRPLQAGL